MPADKNLILLTNTNLTTTATSSTVDIGLGGTPQTSPLVARFFWGTTTVTATINTKIQGSYDNTNWRDLANGDIAVGLADTYRHETGIRFITRRRYIRAIVTGGIVNQVTVTVDMAARSNPEMGLD
jgi:hypothetical protein